MNEASKVPAAPAAPATFEPGSSFGEYTIVRRIGRGGQGSVYEVRDSLGLTWALKVSEEMALSDAAAEARFGREARCLAENLSEVPRNVGILTGEHYGVCARRFYIKMKLLQGESLAQRLRRLGQLSIYDATRLFERVAFAIGHAHDLGVLHRDLKPENVFITDRDEVLVLDWGCLQLIEAGQVRTTLNGVICTPGYAPIEQYLATSIVSLTPAADLYSLGVMFYEALAGYHPFLNWSRAALNDVKKPPESIPPTATPSAPAGPGVATSVGFTEYCAQRGAGKDGDPVDIRRVTVRHADDIYGAVTQHHTVPTRVLDQLRRTLSDAPMVIEDWGATPATCHVNDAPRNGARAQGAPLVNRASAASTRTVRPNAPARPAQRLDAPRVVAKRGVPRRFSLVEVLALQERTAPQPIAGLPPQLQKLLRALLAKRPGARPQSALDVAEQLRALLAGELKDQVGAFADSAPEQHGKYLVRALWLSQLRQSWSRFAFAAAGVVVSGLTGVGAYYGMALTRAEPSNQEARVQVSAQQPRVTSKRETGAAKTQAALPSDKATPADKPATLADQPAAPLLATTPASFAQGDNVPLGSEGRSVSNKPLRRKPEPRVTLVSESLDKLEAQTVNAVQVVSETEPVPQPAHSDLPSDTALPRTVQRLKSSPQARAPGRHMINTATGRTRDQQEQP